MHPVLRQLIAGGAAPVLAALAVFEAGVRLRRDHAVAAAAAALFVAHAGLAGLPPWPPRESLHWLAWAAAAWGALALAVPRWPLALGLPAALAVCAAQLGPAWRYQWEGTGRIAYAGGIAVAVALTAIAFHTLSRVEARLVRLAVPGLVAAAAAAVLVSGSALVGQIGAATAAGLAVPVARHWFSKDRDCGRPAAAFAAAVFGSLLLNGHFYSELKPLPALLVLAAPLCAAISVPLTQRLPALPALFIRLAAAALPALAGIATALRASPPTGYDY
jgi:hypothetical protein